MFSKKLKDRRAILSDTREALREVNKHIRREDVNPEVLRLLQFHKSIFVEKIREQVRQMDKVRA